MRVLRLGLLIPMAAFLALGCGSGTGEESVAQIGEVSKAPESKALSTTIVADLLAMSRAELSAKAEELSGNLQVQEKARREGRLTYSMLPEMRLPLVPAVFHEAKYSSEMSMVVPPYHDGKSRDSGLAFHLARFGDIEGAKKMADPADASLIRRIEACRGEREYPVEWTRLIGMMLHGAQMRLASGEVEASREIVALHDQVRQILDEKARSGPLGFRLLSPGRLALTKVVARLREGSHNALADDIESALGRWGEVPSPTVGVPIGAPRVVLSSLLGQQGQGRAMTSASPLRALDLLDLAFPAEGVRSVFACLDKNDKLANVVILYAPGTAIVHGEPRQMAHSLEEHLGLTREGRAPGIVRRTYMLPGLVAEVALVARGETVGAFIRLGEENPTASVQLPRGFGVPSLERGFEHIRQRLFPEQVGTKVQTERSAALSQVTSPIQGIPLTQVMVTRDDQYDMVERLRFRHSGDEARKPLHETTMALWASGGAPRISGHDEEQGAVLTLIWEDGATRLTLRLPYANGTQIDFDAEDVRDVQTHARRLETIRANERAERKERLKMNAPLTRLPRHLGRSEIQLGMSRGDVEAALPQGGNTIRQALPDGLAVVVMGEAPKNVPYIARHQFIRFDGAERVVELRTRYAEGSGGANWIQTFQAARVKECGAAFEGPGPWANVWPDLPIRKPVPVMSRWQDDLAWMSLQRDAWGIEETLRAVSADTGLAIPLPAFQYLPRGPGDISLGDSREDVISQAESYQNVQDGALLLRPRNPLYDQMLLWFEEDRVSRIVLRETKGLGADGGKSGILGTRLTESWAREARILGWPRRYDLAEDRSIQSLGWHDDRTRVRLFGQATQGGPRVFLEYKHVK